MVGDFTINILASVALLIAGFLVRHCASHYRTRNARQLWRASVSKGLTIALTTRPGDSPGRNRASFGEVRTLLALVPTFSYLHINYRLTESFLSTAREVTDHNVLLLGGPNSNELTSAALDLLSPQLTVGVCTSGTFTIFNREYKTKYAIDGSIEESFGVVVRSSNPFSSDPALTFTAVFGLHSTGTGGAARLLTDEHLVGELRSRVPLTSFAAVVRVRPVGEEFVVKLIDAKELGSSRVQQQGTASSSDSSSDRSADAN